MTTAHVQTTPVPPRRMRWWDTLVTQTSARGTVVTLPLSMWCAHYKIPFEVAMERRKKLHWTPEQIVKERPRALLPSVPRLPRSRRVGPNTLLRVHGEVRRAAEWAKHVGIPLPVLRKRVTEWHWSIEQAITTPINAAQPVAVAEVTEVADPLTTWWDEAVTLGGTTKRMHEWCALRNIPFERALAVREAKGWTCKEILTRTLPKVRARRTTPRVGHPNAKFGKDTLLTVQGVTKTAAAWADERGVPLSVLRQRVVTLGQTHEQAVTAPVQVRDRGWWSRPVTVGDVTRSMKEWCALHDIPYSVAYSRYYIGWSLEDIVTTQKHRHQ
jgi:hypothetical protein